jgi:hypothetical protein
MPDASPSRSRSSVREFLSRGAERVGHLFHRESEVPITATTLDIECIPEDPNFPDPARNYSLNLISYESHSGGLPDLASGSEAEYTLALRSLSDAYQSHGRGVVALAAALDGCDLCFPGDPKAQSCRIQYCMRVDVTAEISTATTGGEGSGGQADADVSPKTCKGWLVLVRHHCTPSIGSRSKG